MNKLIITIAGININISIRLKKYNLIEEEK